MNKGTSLALPLDEQQGQGDEKPKTSTKPPQEPLELTAEMGLSGNGSSCSWIHVWTGIEWNNSLCTDFHHRPWDSNPCSLQMTVISSPSPVMRNTASLKFPHGAWINTLTWDIIYWDLNVSSARSICAAGTCAKIGTSSLQGFLHPAHWAWGEKSTWVLLHGLQRLENVERNKVRGVSHSWRCQERRTGVKHPLVSLDGGKGSVRKDRAEKQLNFLLVRDPSFWAPLKLSCFTASEGVSWSEMRWTKQNWRAASAQDHCSGTGIRV